MKSLSLNTKIDFRKLLATVHGLPNSTNRFGSGSTFALWISLILLTSGSVFWALDEHYIAYERL